MGTSQDARASADVAVCFSGWLRRSVPGAGEPARRHLVDALGADAFLAGTYNADDCPDGRGRCLLARVRMLRPFKAVTLDPMLTVHELNESLRGAPRFAAVAAAYREDENWAGVNWFAPVLGDASLSVLRQLHDYSRSYQQVLKQERRRGANYTRLVHTRLEFDWIAPHAPLALLDPRLVWVPPWHAVNDRHAVVPRRYGADYFQRWELVQSAALLDVLPIESLTHDGPEDVLQNLLVARGIPVGEFPFAAFKGCCQADQRCFRAEHCVHRSFGTPASCAQVTAIGRNGSAVPTAAAGEARQTFDRRGGGCMASGKVVNEVREAVDNWRWMRCPGARLVARPLRLRPLPAVGVRREPPAEWVRQAATFKGWQLFHGRVVISVPAGAAPSFNGRLKTQLVVLEPTVTSSVTSTGTSTGTSMIPSTAASTVLSASQAATVSDAALARRRTERGSLDSACPLFEPPVWPGSRLYSPKRPYRSGPPPIRSPWSCGSITHAPISMSS